jgi:hypothetical protein
MPPTPTPPVRIERGIDAYLANFDRSPYRLPQGPGYQNVEGVSTATGSWVHPNGK